MNQAFNTPLNIFGYDGSELSPTQTVDQTTGLLLVESTLDSVYPSSGAFVVQGQLGVESDGFFDGEVSTVTAIVASTAASTSTTTGSLRVGGGVGIAGDLNVGGLIKCNGGKTVATIDQIPAPAEGQTYTAGNQLSLSGAQFNVVTSPSFSALTITNTTVSTSTTTGALTVAGGAGFAKSIYGGSEFVLTNSNLGVQLNAADRPLVTRGHDPFTSGTYNGVGRWGLFMLSATLTLGIPDNYATNMNISTFNANSTVTKTWFNLAGQTGVISLYSTADSTSTSTGGLVASGGLGVAKNLYVGSNIYAGGNVVATQSWANSTFLPAASLNATTDSSSTATGALVVAGGVGVAKNLYVGGNAHFNHTNGVAGVPTVRVSPSSNGWESSIGFYQNPNMGGAAWVLGHNTASQGSDRFGLYNDTFGSNILAVTNTGVLTLRGTVPATSSITGTLVVAGGAGIAADIYAGGNVYSAGTRLAKITDIPSYTAGAGLSLSSNTFSLVQTQTLSGIFSVTNTTASSSTITGALLVAGGVGVAGDVYAANVYSNGNQVMTVGALSAGSNLTLASNTFSVVNNPTFSGAVVVSNTTVSTSSTSGAMMVSGGVGIGGSLFCGGNMTVPSSQTIYGGYINASGTSFTNVFSGAVSVTNSTDSTSLTTGSLQTLGGAAITRSLWLGSEFVMSNSNLGVQLNATDRPLVTRGHDKFTSGTYNGVGRWGLFMLSATLTLGIPDNYATNMNISTFNANSTVTKTWFNLAGQTGVVTLYSTADSTSTSTGGLVASGGLGVAKTAVVGGTLHANYGATSTAPHIRVSPSTTNAESSVAFYTGTQASGNVWAAGLNVGSIGADKFGLYSSTYGGVPLQVTNGGDILIPAHPKLAAAPPLTDASSATWTANQTGWTTVTSWTISNSAMVGASDSIKLTGKGLWSITGYLTGDAVINTAAINHIGISVYLGGTIIGHTQRWYNFSLGTAIHEFNTVINSTTTDDTIQLKYKKLGNDITGAALVLRITKMASYQ